MTDIKGFFGEHRWLSNFWTLPNPIVDRYEGVWLSYPTVEHAYQAEKSLDLAARVWIMHAETPAAAKQAGRRIRMRTDFDFIKDSAMLELVRQKFYYNPDLAQKLLATGDAALYEVNNWGDTYWGCDSFFEGENRLGQILMQVRKEIQDQN